MQIRKAFAPYLAFAGLCVLAMGLGSAGDFEVYYRAAKQLLHPLEGGGALYQTGEWTPFKYHPITVFFFVPFALMPFGIAKWVWAMANGGMLWDFSRRAKRYFGVSDQIVLLGFLFSLHALTWQLKFANVTFLMLWLLMLAAESVNNGMRVRLFLSDGLSALLVCFKATWLVLLPIWIGLGRVSRVCGLVLWVVVFSAAAYLILGNEPFLGWWGTLQDPLHAHNFPKSDNQSWFGLVYRHREQMGERIPWLLGTSLFGAVFLWLSWPFRKAEGQVLLASSLVWIFCSPLSWIHHQILLVPLFIGCLKGVSWRPIKSWTVAHFLLLGAWGFLNGTGELFWGRAGFTWIHQAGLPLAGLVLLLGVLPKFYRAQVSLPQT